MLARMLGGADVTTSNLSSANIRNGVTVRVLLNGDVVQSVTGSFNGPSRMDVVAVVTSRWTNSNSWGVSPMTMGTGYNRNSLPAGTYGIFGHTTNNDFKSTILCQIGGVNHYYDLYSSQSTILTFYSNGGYLYCENWYHSEGAYTLFLYR